MSIYNNKVNNHVLIILYIVLRHYAFNNINIAITGEYIVAV